MAQKQTATRPKLTVVAKPPAAPLRTVAFGTMPAAKPTPKKKKPAKKAAAAGGGFGSGGTYLLIALVGGYLLLRK